MEGTFWELQTDKTQHHQSQYHTQIIYLNFYVRKKQMQFYLSMYDLHPN